ncbi:MAG: CRP/FNR family transcriptional regulator [Arenicella sp.]|jgi:CRP/FNR family transcriptional regulator
MTIVDYVTAAFPDHSQEFKNHLVNSGRIVKVSAGEEMMSIGGDFKTIPIIVDGSLKVVREDDEGHELFLYYLREGQTCAMSLNCCLMNQPSEVRATVEEDSVIIAINGDVAAQWMTSLPEWRDFILNTYQLRFREMLHTIDGIAFHQLDDRVLQYLKDKSDVHGSIELKLTHQEIADDLNSSREVISRVLKILEKKDKIELHRNRIVLM